MTLIDRNGDFALYRHSIDAATQDDEMIKEIVSLLAISFETLPIYKALRITAQDFYPLGYHITQQALHKKESFLYFVRYEPPIGKTDRILLWSARKYTKYINKIISVFLAEDHLDPCEGDDLSLETLKANYAFYNGAINNYFQYIRNNIKMEKKLEQMLTQPHQILYLSLGATVNEFFGTGIGKWNWSRSIEHIQSCYHFKRIYGICYSTDAVRILEELDFSCIEKVPCKTFEYPNDSGNYPMENMLDTDVASIVEKIYE